MRAWHGTSRSAPPMCQAAKRYTHSMLSEEKVTQTQLSSAGKIWQTDTNWKAAVGRFVPAIFWFYANGEMQNAKGSLPVIDSVDNPTLQWYLGRGWGGGGRNRPFLSWNVSVQQRSKTVLLGATESKSSRRICAEAAKSKGCLLWHFLLMRHLDIYLFLR